jgi:hypothetical protein
MSDKTENLLAQANSETEEKTSVSFAERTFENEAEAKKVFARLSEKLLHIEDWNYSAGISTFILFDHNGNEKQHKQAQIGDFIRIKMPMTGKEDWVKITKIETDNDDRILSVQPAYDPTVEITDQNTTSHFFTADSSNNFCLKRTENRITMYVIGLNEVTNTKETSNILESVRNLATANLGHYLGVQKAEWTTFCRHFLELETEQ